MRRQLFTVFRAIQENTQHMGHLGAPDVLLDKKVLLLGHHHALCVPQEQMRQMMGLLNAVCVSKELILGWVQQFALSVLQTLILQPAPR